MLSINEIVKGLESTRNRRFEDTRFGKIIENDNLENLVNSYSLTTLIATTTDFGEGYIALNDNKEPYYITIFTNNYMGEIQYSYQLRDLTLGGVSYFTKYIINPEPSHSVLLAYGDKQLKLNGILASVEELFSIAELNTEYNVYMLPFNDDDYKYWITFSCDGLLKKITKKPNGRIVKSKANGKNRISDAIVRMNITML